MRADRRQYFYDYRRRPETQVRQRENHRRFREKPGIREREREAAHLYREKYPDRIRASSHRCLEKLGEKQRRLNYDRKYKAMPENRQRRNETRRMKYQTDTDYRRRLIEQNRRRPRNTNRIRQNGWLRKYGISPETYTAFLAEQGGVCAICRRAERMLSRSGKSVRLLAVDHNHLTGQVRGLLCANCNTVLGLVEDRLDILQQAMEYLDRPGRPATEESQEQLWPEVDQNLKQTITDLGGVV